MAEPDLAALLCSRLCHDLIGPVGAIANGVEFLQMEDDAEMQEQAVGLLAGSAADASAKLVDCYSSKFPKCARWFWHVVFCKIWPLIMDFLNLKL